MSATTDNRIANDAARAHSLQGLIRSFWNKGEVRLNPDGTVDEVVAKGVGVHVEQMDDDHWWMSIDGKQGRRMVLNFFRKGKSIRLTVEDDGFHSSGVCEGFKTPNDRIEPQPEKS